MVQGHVHRIVIEGPLGAILKPGRMNFAADGERGPNVTVRLQARRQRLRRPIFYDLRAALWNGQRHDQS